MLVLFLIYYITKWVLILIWKFGPKAWGFPTSLGVCHGVWLPGSMPSSWSNLASPGDPDVTVIVPLAGWDFDAPESGRSEDKWAKGGVVDDGQKPGQVLSELN